MGCVSVTLVPSPCFTSKGSREDLREMKGLFITFSSNFTSGK